MTEDISALMALGHNLDRATELAQADRSLLGTLCHNKVSFAYFFVNDVAFFCLSFSELSIRL